MLDVWSKYDNIILTIVQIQKIQTHKTDFTVFVEILKQRKRTFLIICLSIIHPNILMERLKFDEKSTIPNIFFIRSPNDYLAIIQISLIFWDISKYFLVIGRQKNNKWKVMSVLEQLFLEF